MEEVQQPCPARKEEVPETPVIYIALRFCSSFADCCIFTVEQCGDYVAREASGGVSEDGAGETGFRD